MILNRSNTLLLAASLLFAVTLIGCQTIKQNPKPTTATHKSAQISTTPIVPIISKVARKSEPSDDAEIIIMGPVNYDDQKIKNSDSYKFPELPVDSLNRYDWQLVRWIDNQDFVTEIVSEQPVILDIRHNNLIFNAASVTESFIVRLSKVNIALMQLAISPCPPAQIMRDILP